MRTGNTAEVLTALRQYEAEIGIFGKTSAALDLDTLPLGASPIIALAAPGYFDTLSPAKNISTGLSLMILPVCR